MSLYKIAEPNQPDTQSSLAVGIDLGTTHSLAAVITEKGECDFLADERGTVLLPSAVSFLDDTVVVGDRLAAGALVSTKRLMGQSPAAVAHLPFPFAQLDDKAITLKTARGSKTAVEVASEILKTLWKRAEQAYPDHLLKGAVITVPAYFDDAARKATTDAARLAQIPVLRLINEPTAAAYAYGYGQEASSNLLVFDFGGGTFDVSLLALEKGVFRVLATAGDLQCGGDNVDELLTVSIAHQLEIDLDYEGFKELREQAKRAKELLASKEVVELSVAGKTIQIDRTLLAEAINPLVQNMLALCEQTIKDAQLNKSAINDILLVGGSTRLVALQSAITQWFGKPVKTDCDPDTIVARGAAYQADRLAGNKRHEHSDLLVDVTPLSIGLEMMGGINEKIIARNTPVPASARQRFTTYQDGQTGLLLHIVQGERELAEDCLSLGRCELSGLPAKAAGKVEVEVTFTLDADGLLTVSAKALESDAAVSIELKPSYGLDDETVLEMLESSLKYADQDVRLKQKKLKVLEAQQLLDVLHSTLSADGAVYLSESELTDIEAAMSAVSQIIKSDAPLPKLSEALKVLEPLASHYIDCRLQAGVQHVLGGQSIDKLED